MHDSLQNDVKDGEVSCDCLHENVCIQNLSNELICKERSECKCAEECQIERNKEKKVTQRVRSNYAEEDEDVSKKNRRNREE